MDIEQLRNTFMSKTIWYSLTEEQLVYLKNIADNFDSGSARKTILQNRINQLQTEVSKMEEK